jgi:hypothetical protein
MKCPAMGPAGRMLGCLEILMSMPGSLGQVLHKDTWVQKGDDIINGIMNLNGEENQSTTFPIYSCERFPDCVLPGSNEPLEWDTLPKAAVYWGLGMSILFWPWVIHGAPPNLGIVNARFVLFWSSFSRFCRFTDSLVITEKVSRDMRKKYEVQGARREREREGLKERQRERQRETEGERKTMRN